MARAPRKSKPAQRGAKRPSKNRKKVDRDAPLEAPMPLAGMTARTQSLLCLAFLFLVSVSFFWPIHFGGKTIVANDTTAYLASAEAIIQYEAATGKPGLWAPNMFSGMPAFLIRYPPRVPQVDNVLKLLRTIVWPTSHLIALLGGMFLLAFRITRDRWSSLIAAVAYGLTTYIPVILIAGHNTKFVSLCLAPWLLVAIHYGFERPRPLAALFMAAAVAINLRGGHVQITYYFLFVILIWWLVEGVSAIRKSALRSFALSTATFLVGGILGLMMAAQPYLATFEFKAFSIRGATAGGDTGGLVWDAAMAWSQGIAELVTLVVANAFGGSGAEYWGPKSITSGPHYITGVVVVLSVFAAITVRRTVVIAFAVSSILLTLFALGENVPLLNRPMFEYFPLFDAFRAPETWLAIVACLTAVLAAVGLSSALGTISVARIDAAGSSASAPASGAADSVLSAPTWKKYAITCLSVAGILVILLVAKDAFFSFEKPGEFELLANNVSLRQQIPADDPRVVQAVSEFLSSVQAERADMFVRDVLRTLAALAATFGALVLFRRRRVGRDIVAVAFAVVVLIDLFGVGRRYLGNDSLADKSAVEQRVPTYDFDAYIVDRVEEAGGSGHFRVLSLEASPLTNARPSYAYESIGGYHGAKLRNYQDFLEQVLFRRGLANPNLNALDLLGVRYIVGQSVPPGYALAFESPQTGLRVFERVGFIGRARLVGNVEVVAQREAIWQRVETASDAGQLAMVPEPLSAPLAPVDSTSRTSVAVEHYDPNTIRWNVDTDGPRLLVTGEIYYPAGWTAAVDGEPVEIVEVNGLFRGVEVPAGPHVVEMRFRPASDRIGFLISLLSTILVYGGIVLLLGLSYKRSRAGVAPESGTPG